MSFQTIETQEQLDQVIGERISRAKENARKEFEGWLSPDEFTSKTSEITARVEELNKQLLAAQEQIADHDKAMADKDAQLKNYEIGSVKTKIANEYGLSYNAIEFLKGEDEDSIRESAEHFKALVKATHVAPLADPEGGTAGGDSREEALRQLAQDLAD